ncbi:hypothetical protein HELRODRAFT_175307 [Helobdella robusta]|uniref:BRICHOS domain-containing protein n=1 Tax=Helobdella robusta TaxID=6412 RepID=T1F946_HELRO|nr:hypothetical protein HELRODRAFT_175307 [Helobdella robusta]ESO00819.1 hypothetical protein HELRODRAFT_175307 [Helobdella robusta]
MASLAVLVICAVVSIFVYMKAQNQIIEYKLKMLDGRSQEVSGDLTENTVRYHVQDTDQEAWVIDDFNTYIRVTKITTKRGETNCYLAPLNVSTAMEPSKVSKPASNNEWMEAPGDHSSTIYQISGVSTYWMYPTCGNDHPTPNENQLNEPSKIQKREAPYYVLTNHTRDGVHYYPCINGCCQTVCAEMIQYHWEIINGRINCNWVPTNLTELYCEATPGLNCNPC